MRQVLFVLFALLLGACGYYFGQSSSKPKIEQLANRAISVATNYDKMDINRPSLEEVQRLYCSVSGFHDTIIGMRGLTILAGRITEIDEELNLTFQEIYDATIVSQHTVKLAGVSITDKAKTRDLMEQMLLGHPDPRVLVVMPAKTEDEIAEAVVASHSAFNNYAFTYVQGELIDAQVAVVRGKLNAKMKFALERIQKYGLKPCLTLPKNRDWQSHDSEEAVRRWHVVFSQ